MFNLQTALPHPEGGKTAREPFGGILALPPIPEHEKSKEQVPGAQQLNTGCLGRAGPFSTLGSSGRARLSLTMPGDLAAAEGAPLQGV